MTISLTQKQARALWMQAQGLNQEAPFGRGPQATTRAIEHLGYVQIDTINVIERCHHHILFSRIPDYKRQHLQKAQSQTKTVFEYWTHALSYVPTKDFRFFMSEMQRIKKTPGTLLRSVKKEELQKVLNLIKTEGPLSIRDIEDDILVEKKHPWGSRKPSKKALQLGFHSGQLVISERLGMLKCYELTDRHFDWKEKPKAATQREVLEYLLDRALRSQVFVSIESICYLNNSKKDGMKKLIEQKVKSKTLIPVKVEGFEKVPHWMCPEDIKTADGEERIHILSPFDPLVIQRKRLAAIFNYEHRFEAYVPKEKRRYGYFALPVLEGDEVVAALDLKTDRKAQKLLIQKWSWIGKSSSPQLKRKMEEELHRFEKFQLS